MKPTMGYFDPTVRYFVNARGILVPAEKIEMDSVVWISF